MAVLISKIYLLLKYKDIDFMPQVYCLDFLRGGSAKQQHSVFEGAFDYIATNPPWSAMDGEYGHIDAITSKETFSYFFVKAYGQLKDNGIIRFLFPETILNVKIHKDIRKFILDTAGLLSITTYDDTFSGVTTKYVDIACGKDAAQEKFDVYAGNRKRAVDIKTIYETENLIYNLLSDDDVSIVRLVKDRGRFSLQNSIWALGVVTGDNKGKLSSECLAGMEKIYTGKEIQPYVLRPAKNYILYDRDKRKRLTVLQKVHPGKKRYLAGGFGYREDGMHGFDKDTEGGRISIFTDRGTSGQIYYFVGAGRKLCLWDQWGRQRY